MEYFCVYKGRPIKLGRRGMYWFILDYLVKIHNYLTSCFGYTIARMYKKASQLFKLKSIKLILEPCVELLKFQKDLSED